LSPLAPAATINSTHWHQLDPNARWHVDLAVRPSLIPSWSGIARLLRLMAWATTQRCRTVPSAP